MEMVKLSEFVLNPDNPQKWTDAAMADLVQSVRAEERTLDANKIAYCTDYVSPISGESFAGQKVVIAGNKRLMALRKIHRFKNISRIQPYQYHDFLYLFGRMPTFIERVAIKIGNLICR